MMNLKYTIPFKTTDNRGYCVRIYSEDYTGSPVELTGAPPCVKITQKSDDFLLTPSRPKTATISIITDRILADLFSSEPMRNRVQIFKGSFDFNDDFNADFDGNAPVIVWSGWVKPEVFTQDWHTDTSVIQIECESDLSVLASIPYTEEIEDTFGSVSFAKLIGRASFLAGDYYKYLIAPDLFPDDDNVINNLSVAEQAIKDALTGDGLTWLEAIEEFCKILGWTLCEQEDTLYLVDALASKGSVNYLRYPISQATTGPGATITPRIIPTREIGPRNTTSNSLDVLKSYNVASVSVESDNLEDSFKSIDYDDMDVLQRLPASTWYPKDSKYYSTYRELLIPKEDRPYGWMYHIWYINTSGTTGSRTLDQLRQNAATANNYSGGIPVRGQKLEGEVSNVIKHDPLFRLKNAVRCRIRNTASRVLPDFTPLVGVRMPLNIYEGNSSLIVLGNTGAPMERKTAGAIVIDFRAYAHLTQDMTWEEVEQGKSHATAGLFAVVAQLKIGDWYFGRDLNVSDDVPKWRRQPAESLRYFTIYFDLENLGGDWMQIYCNKESKMPYDVSAGYIVELIHENPEVDFTATGELEFNIVSYDIGSTFYGYTFENLSVRYVRPEVIGSKDDSREYKKDNHGRGYRSEADEISLRLSTKNTIYGPSWGDLIMNNSVFMDSQLVNRVTGRAERPEDVLLHRVLTMYQTPRIKLTEGLRSSDVRPCDILTENKFPGKKFIITGRSTDLEYEREEVQIIEV